MVVLSLKLGIGKSNFDKVGLISHYVNKVSQTLNLLCVFFAVNRNHTTL